MDANDWPPAAVSEQAVAMLFAKMRQLYGVRLHVGWPEHEILAVKRLWGIVLGTLSAGQIRYGMKALESLKEAPGLLQFVTLCQPALAALEDDRKSIDIELASTDRLDHKRWARRIQYRIVRGDPTVSKQMVRTVRAILN